MVRRVSGAGVLNVISPAPGNSPPGRGLSVVGTAGLEPAISRSQSGRRTSWLRSDDGFPPAPPKGCCALAPERANRRTSRTARGTRTPNLLILNQAPLPSWASAACAARVPPSDSSTPLDVARPSMRSVDSVRQSVLHRARAAQSRTGRPSAPRPGFEPGLPTPEAGVLPLHQQGNDVEPVRGPSGYPR